VAEATADEDDVELVFRWNRRMGYWRICKIGLDTAKNILKQDVEDLVRRTDRRGNNSRCNEILKKNLIVSQ
jgi:N utilization substance protein A